jgi:hypothetical protein
VCWCVCVYRVGWRCRVDRTCRAAQVIEVSQSVVDEVVYVVMAFWRMLVRQLVGGSEEQMARASIGEVMNQGLHKVEVEICPRELYFTSSA